MKMQKTNVVAGCSSTGRNINLIKEFRSVSEESDRERNRKRNRKRHKKLHKSFDELFACYIQQHDIEGGYTNRTIQELMDWSYKMTQVGHD